MYLYKKYMYLILRLPSIVLLNLFLRLMTFIIFTLSIIFHINHPFVIKNMVTAIIAAITNMYLIFPFLLLKSLQ